VVAPVTNAWPHGRSAAVVITVAFEAELAILAVAPDATDRAKSLSVGTYGATRGVPRLLAELARRGTPSTWFVHSALLERYPEQGRAIRDAGHELANCGVVLEDFGAMDTAAQLAMVRRAQEAFQHSLGVLPTGFRVGRGEMSPGLPAALEAEGFAWTSSLRGDDRPHFHAAPAGRLVEIRNTTNSTTWRTSPSTWTHRSPWAAHGSPPPATCWTTGSPSSTPTTPRGCASCSPCTPN
jgi:peptidoglycan/xylan/chitin deacetylase (PgdA/CDA1 family)